MLKFHNEEPTCIRRLANAILRSNKNVWLSGLPGSGKSTIAELLAGFTGYKLLNADSYCAWQDGSWLSTQNGRLKLYMDINASKVILEGIGEDIHNLLLPCKPYLHIHVIPTFVNYKQTMQNRIVYGDQHDKRIGTHILKNLTHSRLNKDYEKWKAVSGQDPILVYNNYKEKNRMSKTGRREVGSYGS